MYSAQYQGAAALIASGAPYVGAHLVAFALFSLAAKLGYSWQAFLSHGSKFTSG